MCICRWLLICHLQPLGRIMNRFSKGNVWSCVYPVHSYHDFARYRHHRQRTHRLIFFRSSFELKLIRISTRCIPHIHQYRWNDYERHCAGIDPDSVVLDSHIRHPLRLYLCSGILSCQRTRIEGLLSFVCIWSKTYDCGFSLSAPWWFSFLWPDDWLDPNNFNLSDAILRSSLYTHFSESLSGLATIRVYKEIDRFQSENQKRVDVENRAYWLTAANQVWCIWLASLCSTDEWIGLARDSYRLSGVMYDICRGDVECRRTLLYISSTNGSPHFICDDRSTKVSLPSLH